SGDSPHRSPHHRPPEQSTVEALERNTPHDRPEHAERLKHIRDVPPAGETRHNGPQQVIDAVEVHDVKPGEAAHAELSDAGVQRECSVPEGRWQACYLDLAVREYRRFATFRGEHGHMMSPLGQVASEGLDLLSLAAGFGGRRVDLRDAENPQ